MFSQAPRAVLQRRPARQLLPAQHGSSRAPHASQVSLALQIRWSAQVRPRQQGCPSDPQRVHVVPSQAEPAAHVLPAQHIWLSAPQGAQLPPLHARPGLQLVPPQQASPESPQPRQLPLTQVLPSLQRSPAQQASPLAPQPVAQKMPVQTAVPSQMRPAQQGCPGMPQSMAAHTLVIALQMRPPSHTSPAQQV